MAHNAENPIYFREKYPDLTAPKSAAQLEDERKAAILAAEQTVAAQPQAPIIQPDQPPQASTI